MQENFPFVRDDVLPSWWANAIQRFIGNLSIGLTIEKQSDTVLRIPAAPDDLAAAIGIDGHWRWNEATVSRAHPGGANGTYPIYVTAKNNDVRNVPAAGSDFTDYSFDLRIVPPATTPVIVAGVVDIYRKIGTCTWSEGRITAIQQTVGIPQQGWAVGDVKPSLQTADHPGWKLCNGRQSIARNTVPQGFVDAMLAAGFPGDSGLTIGVPDYRGRALYGLGSHADVNAFTDNDGLALANRRAKHVHTVAAHHHVTPSGIGLVAGDFTFVNPSLLGAFYAEPTEGDMIRWIRPRVDGYQFMNTGGPVDLYGVPSSDASPATDAQGPAYGVVNWFVYTGESTGSAGDAGGGGGVGAPNVQGANYTLAAGDAEGVVEMNAGGATVVTVPPQADVAFAVGTVIEVDRMGAGAVTIAPGAGVTLRAVGGALELASQYSAASLRKRAADEWHVVGDLS